MKNLIKIEPIAVKDKNDVVKALTILERIGIVIKTDEQKENYLQDTSKTVENNFMIQEDDGGFRIQSHYIGWGISIESLEEQVNSIVEKYPNICETIKDVQTKVKKLSEEISILEDTKVIEIIQIKEK